MRRRRRKVGRFMAGYSGSSTCVRGRWTRRGQREQRKAMEGGRKEGKRAGVCIITIKRIKGVRVSEGW
jgi:hypothetical protein